MGYTLITINMVHITFIFIFYCFYVCSGNAGADELSLPIPEETEGIIAEKLILPLRLLAALDEDYDIKRFRTSDNRRARREDIRAEMIKLYTTTSAPDIQKTLESNEFKTFYKNCVNGNVNILTPRRVNKLMEMQRNAKKLKKRWTESGTLLDFVIALSDELLIPKLALMQSFLLRQEKNEIDWNMESKLYRLSSADVAEQYKVGKVNCLDRFMSTAKPKNGWTFLRDNERTDGIPPNLKEMQIVIKKPIGTPCGVYIPHKSEAHTYYKSEYEKNQREVLIPAGTCFKVTQKGMRKNKNKNLKFKIEMECLKKGE